LSLSNSDTLGYFQPATLFHTLVMLVLLVGGLGLIARALAPHGPRA
jgi:hypothetical protein